MSDVPLDDSVFPQFQWPAGPDPTRAGCSTSGVDRRSATAALLAPLRGRPAEGRAPTSLLSSQSGPEKLGRCSMFHV